MRHLIYLFTSCFLIIMTPFAYGTSQTTPEPATDSNATTSTNQPVAGATSADSNAASANSGDSQEYSPESREYHLKAAFLRYVAKYVKWPAASWPAGVTNLCVLGLVPSFDALNSINGKVVEDRTITIIKLMDVKDAITNHCQILFVTKTEEDNTKDILSLLKTQPILTFGDMDKFAEQGGDMNFYVANNRLAIMANLPAIKKSGLTVDDHMIRLITIVPS